MMRNTTETKQARPSRARALLPLALAALQLQAAQACTAIDLQAADGSVVTGRTMEWTRDLHWHVIAVPRGTRLALSAPAALQRPPRFFASRYAFIGIAAGAELDAPALLEGQNSAGLGISANFLPGFTRYQDVGPDDPQSVAITQFSAWALGSFATVDALHDALARTKVWAAPALLRGADPATLHFLIVDRSGRGMVVEYIDGQLQIHDDLVHVLTNAPPYAWHLTHLRAYIDVDPIGRASAQIGGQTLQALGSGSNLLALPGDLSPPSRFVRMAFMRAHGPQPRDAAQALQTVAHWLNSVDIPPGVAGERVGEQLLWDSTQWVALKDLRHNVLYIADAAHRTNYVKFDLQQLQEQRGSRQLPLATLPYPPPADLSDLLR